MIVYLARDIPAFVMYCVNGESGSSLLIESTDSMIHSTSIKMAVCDIKCKRYLCVVSNGKYTAISLQQSEIITVRLHPKC